MPKYRVEVLVKTLEYYEVEAENEDDAELLWPEGKLVYTNDNLGCEIIDIEEIARDIGVAA